MKKKDNHFFPGLYHISRVYIIGVCMCVCASVCVYALAWCSWRLCCNSPSVKTIGYFFCSRRGIKTRIYRRGSRRGEMAYFKDLLPTPVISRQIEPILFYIFFPFISQRNLFFSFLSYPRSPHLIDNTYNTNNDNNNKNNSLLYDSSTSRGTLTDYKYYVIIIICISRERIIYIWYPPHRKT